MPRRPADTRTLPDLAGIGKAMEGDLHWWWSRQRKAGRLRAGPR